MAEVVKWLRPRIVVPICVGSNPIFRPIFKIEMRKLLLIFIISLSITSVFATTNKVTLYDCHPDSNSTIANIVPGAVEDEKNCIGYGSPSSQAYKECTKKVREYNQNTLNLYKAGKCQKSGYRMSGDYEGIKCSIDYDSTRIKAYSSQGLHSLSDACFKNLAKEIKAQYPNIKGDNKYGFTTNTNNVTRTKVNRINNQLNPAQPFKRPSATGKNSYYNNIK